MNRKSRKEKFLQVDLYPVTCERLSAGRSNLDLLEAAIRGGAKIIQLREKELPTGDLYRMALAFRKITAEAGMLLIINDRVDIALAVDADGVHLGQEDLPLSAARRIAPELLIGISTHSREEALKAQGEGADYVNIGPIFPTRTKEGVSRFLGPEAIPGDRCGPRDPLHRHGGDRRRQHREGARAGGAPGGRGDGRHHGRRYGRGGCRPAGNDQKLQSSLTAMMIMAITSTIRIIFSPRLTDILAAHQPPVALPVARTSPSGQSIFPVRRTPPSRGWCR